VFEETAALDGEVRVALPSLGVGGCEGNGFGDVLDVVDGDVDHRVAGLDGLGEDVGGRHGASFGGVRS